MNIMQVEKKRITGIPVLLKWLCFMMIVLTSTTQNVRAQYTMTLVSDLANADGKFSFVNENVGYHFSTPKILKTTDGGNTWFFLSQNIISQVHPTGEFMSGQFVSENTGWLVVRKDDNIASINDSSFLYKTVDGGVNWTLQRVNPPNTIQYAAALFSKVHFKNEQEGWIYGNGLLERTSDGGNTWTTIIHDVGETSNNNNMRSMTFSDQNNAYIVGYGAWIQHSSDGGVTWNDQHYYPGVQVTDDYYMHDVDFMSSDTGIVSTGGMGLFERTFDGGQTWTQMNTGFDHYNNAVAFEKNSSTIWFASGDYCTSAGCFRTSALMYSNDFGNNWTALIDSTENNRYWDVVWPAENYGFTCNKKGEIYKIEKGIAGEEKLTNIEALSVFPNPTSENVKLVYPESVKELHVFNLLGKEVLQMELSPSGGESCSLSTVEPGVYLFTFTNEKGQQIGAKRVVKK